MGYDERYKELKLDYLKGGLDSAFETGWLAQEKSKSHCLGDPEEDSDFAKEQ